MCTHTRTCTHTDWACNACSDFGFLFPTLSLQSVHVHECRHMCTHTHAHTRTHTHTLGLYHLQSLYKAYMCMNEHTYTHVHTHTGTTCSEFGFLFLTLSLFLQSVHVHECTHLCTHIVMYTACTPYICHTYSTYTYSTLALLRKWNLVHNTYIHS